MRRETIYYIIANTYGVIPVAENVISIYIIIKTVQPI